MTHYRDCHGRRIRDGMAQRAVMMLLSAIIFPLVLLSLLVWPPPKRWGDPRYRW